MRRTLLILSAVILTVLKNDPARDVRALAAVDYTLRDGKVIDRSPR